MSNINNSSITEITNLIYRYNELIDEGNFESASAIFKDAKLKLVISSQLEDFQAFHGMLNTFIKVYEDGTPKTKHIVTNPIIQIDETAGKAKSRTHYTVFQATTELPFQAIAGGRYHDEFECIDGQWRFCYRDFTLLDFRGNIEHHLNLDNLPKALN